MTTNHTDSNTDVNAISTYREFIWGVARGLDCDYSAASEHWASYSRQLSDAARERIEAEGQDGGFTIGNEIRDLNNTSDRLAAFI